ncbi:hypothetical protein DESACE_08705 [Desulfurella acetivorans A63]|nr:hypothetical protein DESACE_08705 [Desulfurella acetivorans A63]
MKKIVFFILLGLFLASCSVRVKNVNNTGYNYLQPEVSNVSQKNEIKINSVNLDNVESNRLKNNYILYESNGVYNYFAYSKWINSPPTMLKDFILENIRYIKQDPYAKYRLKILLFNYEPHFNNKESFFYFKARAFLYNSQYELLASKMFDYKKDFKKNTNESMLDAAGKATQEFLENLNEWLLGVLK